MTTSSPPCLADCINAAPLSSYDTESQFAVFELVTSEFLSQCQPNWVIRRNDWWKIHQLHIRKFCLAPADYVGWLCPKMGLECLLFGVQRRCYDLSMQPWINSNRRYRWKRKHHGFGLQEARRSTTATATHRPAIMHSATQYAVMYTHALHVSLAFHSYEYAPDWASAPQNDFLRSLRRCGQSPEDGQHAQPQQLEDLLIKWYPHDNWTSSSPALGIISSVITEVFYPGLSFSLPYHPCRATCNASFQNLLLGDMPALDSGDGSTPTSSNRPCIPSWADRQCHCTDSHQRQCIHNDKSYHRRWFWMRSRPEDRHQAGVHWRTQHSRYRRRV